MPLVLLGILLGFQILRGGDLQAALVQQASLAAAAVVQQATAAVVQHATAVVGAVLHQQAAKFAHATAVDVVQQPMHAQKGAQPASLLAPRTTHPMPIHCNGLKPGKPWLSASARHPSWPCQLPFSHLSP